MLDAICPSCGRGGSLPREKVNTRLVCRNCMQVFHVTARNVCVKGEPPAGSMTSAKGKSAKSDASRSREPRESLSVDLGGVRAPYKIVGIGLLLLIPAWFVWPLIFSGPETLEQQSTRLARAILDGKNDRVESLATTDTRADAMKWLGEVIPKLEVYRKRWPGHDLNVSSLVISEAKTTGRAETIAYFAPPMAAARGDLQTESIGKVEPLSFKLVWVLDQSDRWFLNARETAKAGAQ